MSVWCNSNALRLGRRVTVRVRHIQLCGVEQSGSSPGSCPGGRGFKSPSPPQFEQKPFEIFAWTVRALN